MGLPARQQRLLDDIESAIEAREPRMAAMFAIFTRLTRGEGLPSVERLTRPVRAKRRPGLLRPGMLTLLPMAAVLTFLAGFLIALATGGASACATTSSTVQHQSAASCLSRPSPSPGNPGKDGYTIFPGAAK
jgi:hypothetical protein